MIRRNKEIAKANRKPCIVCGRPGEGDHIKPFKGWACMDIPENVWPLCREHHTEKGTGLNRFVKKYKLESELIARGFEWDDFYDGWLRKF